MSLAGQLEGFVHSPGVPPVAFVLAFAAGAGHAVMPGHGKSLAAAYLVGERGRVRDAAWLGGSVAVMHTLSVLVIGVAWTFLSLSDVLRLEQLTTGLQLVGGLLVIATGLWLLKRHRNHRGHGHGHGHGHRHGHGEASRPGLVLLGISGGLTPSPSAFLVLVAGLFLGRAGFALLLVITFGLGMAVVLFGVGLLAVAGSNVVVRGGRSHHLLHTAARVAPLVAATGITLAGVVMTTYAATQLATRL
jgi:nickel/cobalt exporter